MADHDDSDDLGLGLPARDWAALGLPDIRDLSERLRFTPTEGRIWLSDQRMMLMHTSAFGVLRRELIDSMGVDGARGLLTRFGYAAGSRDGHLARQVRPDADPVEAFSVGPQLHALEGIVLVEPVRLEMDVAQGRFYGEFIWHDSSEDDAHIGTYGVGVEPACWMQIGYACGYTSVFMGRPILYREVECRAQSDAHCRIVGKPVAEWDDPSPDLRFLEAGRQRVPEVGDAQARMPTGEPAPISSEVEIVGASAAFLATAHKVEQVACADTTVLFLGETGVGKEKFARLLHAESKRASGPFIAVNCAAIPENLVEAELFGVEKGAYTGAQESRPGKFERAAGGTLFLDEVGTLSLAAQAKLLRVLQEREIERVGGTSTRAVDVRVVAATNVDLRDEVKARRFRADLFYRLGVFPVRIPPLRERRDDIPVLMNHFLGRYTASIGKNVPGFTPRALALMLDHAYPGNIRELENMIERGVIMARDGQPIGASHLFIDGPPPGFMSLDGQGRLGPVDTDDDEAVGELVGELLDRGVRFDGLETQLLDAAVTRAEGNVSQAAKLLGLSRAQLVYRLKKRRES